MNVSTYYYCAGSFNAAKVIYALPDTIYVEGAIASPMFGDDRVIIEIPEQLSTVTIVPLVDNATFEYLDKTYSFGRSNADTIGRFKLATASSNPSLTISK